MKKTLITNFKINISVYIVVYFIAAFVNWDIYNPFQWIINIPNYNPIDRGLGLFMFSLWQTIQLLILYDYFSSRK